MINLMPYDLKKQTNAARANTVLTIYIIISLFAVSFLALACYTTYTIINSSPETSTDSSATSQQDINTSKIILDQQISYSDVLSSLSSILPAEVAIDSLSTSDIAIDKILTVKVRAKNEAAINTVQINIQSLRIFSNYKLISNDQVTKSDGYSREATFTVNLNRSLTQ